MARTALLRGFLVVFIAAAGLSGAIAVGQEEPTTQPARPPASAPAEREVVLASVIEVQGDAQYTPLGAADWKPCQVGDEYPPGTIIRTGFRSAVKFQIGDEEPYTALVVESATRSIISEAHKTADTKRVRIGVGYGRIRAGVAEGGLKSDFTVDSPVATLSKRGTWNFGMFYERASDRFEVFLLDRGLVEAFNEVTRERRGLRPGEIVTQAMRRWADQAQILRNVAIPDLLGQGDVQVVFNRLRQDGLGVIDPAGGRTVLIDLSNDLAQREFARLLQARLTTPVTPRLPSWRPGEIRPGKVPRPEGYFGTGRGDQLIPVIIEAGSPLAQKGLAKPGSYKFRRSALENWMKHQGAKP